MALALLLLIFGCDSGYQPLTDTAVPYEPFSSSWEFSPGQMATVSGWRAGYRPSESIPFQIGLENGSASPWQGEFFLLLVDEKCVAAKLAHQEFALPPGETLQVQVTAQFPDYLKNNPHGLVLLIPEWGTATETIWIGIEPSGRIPEWPQLPPERP
jgi:hypothetical protein